MGCDPDLAIAIAIANQDHGLDGYVGEAWILILILAITRSGVLQIALWAMPMTISICP